MYYKAGLLQPMPEYSHKQPLGITVRVSSQPDFNRDRPQSNAATIYICNTGSTSLDSQAVWHARVDHDEMSL